MAWDLNLASADNIDINQLYRLLMEKNIKPLFQGAHSLAFPATAVNHYDSDQTRPVVELNCLALVGVSSPLPHYFITDTLDEEHHSLRCFLGIFNQIIYLAYFRAWSQKNTHLFRGVSRAGQDLMCALSTIDIHSHDETAAVAPFFMYHTRNIYGLQAMLRYLYQDIPIEVQRVQCDWTHVHAPVRLGQASSPALLSDNLTLGGRIPTVSGKINITVGPIDSSALSRFLPSVKQGESLVKRVKEYVNHAASLNYNFIIQPPAHTQRLGTEMILSRTSFLLGNKKIASKQYMGV